MKLHFKIIGYYEHYNFGDDQYKISFTKLFKDYILYDYTIDFYNCDKIHDYIFLDDDIIIIGGGDVLNPYFLNKINKRFESAPNLIIAFSVGLPYTQILVETNKLDIIDYIFLRTDQDIEIFKRYFNKDRVFYIPDLSYIINSNNRGNINQSGKFIELNEKGKFDELQIITKIKMNHPGKQIICLCLSRHVYNANYKREYTNIIDNLCVFVKFLIKQNYHVVFLPFNTNSDNPSENDILINNDVISNLESTTNITNINTTLNEYQLQTVLKNTNICICMRFHAILFSIYNNVPFIPIYTTRKINNLLKDISWEYSYRLPTNEKFIPTNIDIDVLKTLLMQLNSELQQNIYQKLLHINKNIFGSMFFKNINKFINIITHPSIHKKPNTTNNNVDELISKTHDSIMVFCNNHGYTHYSNIKDENLQKIITSIVSYNLIGVINSEYNWGLSSKMFSDKNYDYSNEWKWIINDHINTKYTALTNNPHGLFNIKYIDQVDYSGAHRSGWQYVYDNLKHLHKEDSDLLLDLYVDKTFHWNRDLNTHLNIIPYKKDWVGFIHHTFDTTFSDYNCHNLLHCQEFIESLSCCRGLIVLSRYLQSQLQKELDKINMGNIKVYYITHPTEVDVLKFNPKLFFKNDDKKLLHIGGWLRNVYSFYNITLPKYILCKSGFILGDKDYQPLQFKKCKIKKVALRGKHMNNYYPNSDFITNLKNTLSSNTHFNFNYSTNLPNCSSNSPNCSSNPPNCSSSVGDTVILTNNWNLHFYQDIYNKINTVDFIDYVSNSDYDELITKNIVYINLVDASAVNTVIECIVRTTPIIVNNHPAVVELLGRGYPLYLKSNMYDYCSINNEINQMLRSDKLLRRAHLYLKNLDKQKFYISKFLKDFKKLIITF